MSVEGSMAKGTFNYSPEAVSGGGRWQTVSQGTPPTAKSGLIGPPKVPIAHYRTAELERLDRATCMALAAIRDGLRIKAGVTIPPAQIRDTIVGAIPPISEISIATRPTVPVVVQRADAPTVPEPRWFTWPGRRPMFS